MTEATTQQPKRPVFYIGADGTHTPMRQGGTREAKVGVMFWEADHLRLSKTRATVKHRKYVATLDGIESFREQLNRCYAQTVQQCPHQVVFLGDLNFPDKSSKPCISKIIGIKVGCTMLPQARFRLIHISRNSYSLVDHFHLGYASANICPYKAADYEPINIDAKGL